MKPFSECVRDQNEHHTRVIEALSIELRTARTLRNAVPWWPPMAFLVVGFVVLFMSTAGLTLPSLIPTWGVCLGSALGWHLARCWVLARAMEVHLKAENQYLASLKKDHFSEAGPEHPAPSTPT